MKVVVEFWTWRKLRCEEDEDGVERKWRRERKVKVESYVKMRWVVRFMQVGVGLVRVIRG